MIQRAQSDPHYYVLAVIGAVAVVISLYFYLGVGKAIYMQEAEDTSPIPVSPAMRVALYVCMAAMIGLGIYQLPLVNASIVAAKVFGLH